MDYSNPALGDPKIWVREERKEGVAQILEDFGVPYSRVGGGLRVKELELTVAEDLAVSTGWAPETLEDVLGLSRGEFSALLREGNPYLVRFVEGYSQALRFNRVVKELKKAGLPTREAVLTAISFLPAFAEKEEPPLWKRALSGAGKVAIAGLLVLPMVAGVGGVLADQQQTEPQPNSFQEYAFNVSNGRALTMGYVDDIIYGVWLEKDGENTSIHITYLTPIIKDTELFPQSHFEDNNIFADNGSVLIKDGDKFYVIPSTTPFGAEEHPAYILIGGNGSNVSKRIGAFDYPWIAGLKDGKLALKNLKTGALIESDYDFIPKAVGPNGSFFAEKLMDPDNRIVIRGWLKNSRLEIDTHGANIGDNRSYLIDGSDDLVHYYYFDGGGLSRMVRTWNQISDKLIFPNQNISFEGNFAVFSTPKRVEIGKLARVSPNGPEYRGPVFEISTTLREFQEQSKGINVSLSFLDLDGEITLINNGTISPAVRERCILPYTVKGGIGIALTREFADHYELRFIAITPEKMDFGEGKECECYEPNYLPFLLLFTGGASLFGAGVYLWKRKSS